MDFGPPCTATVPADGQPLEVITHRDRHDGPSSVGELAASGFTVVEEVPAPAELW